MVKTGQRAIYNSRIIHMLSPRFSSLGALCAALALLLHPWPGTAWAADWDSSEQQLATKIIAVTGSGPAAMEINNRSSLGPNDVDDIRRGLTAELSSRGLKWASADSAAFSIEVSLSENVQQYVWVAEVRKGASDPTVLMVSTSRSNAGPARDTAGSTLRKTLLWSSDTQILDAVVVGPQRMAVLYPGQLQFYRLQTDRWVEDQSFPVPHSRVWPRDLRGRLVLNKDRSVEAHLPGIVCQSSVVGPLSVSCREDDDPWPIGTDQYSLKAFFAQSRNFFTGVLSPGIGNQSAFPPFYSAAPAPPDHGTRWAVAAVDGRIHILDSGSDLVAPKLNWGSDIAAIKSSCGLRWQILATDSGSTGEDAVRAYEMPGRDAIAVGQAVSFPGSITSLWTAPEDNGAVAVAHNSETGKYEAYLLTMACSQ
jgi:hypothetical protein